jgi:TrmH family RNA methyltransferase
MSPARSPSGVVALARRPVEGTSGMFSRGTPLVVIAVDVQDPGNFGALLRSAEAGGATGVIATESGADPFGWKALRGAMGSAFRLPVARVSDGAAAVALARSHGLRVAAAIGRGGTPMSDADLTGPLALVVGGEGSGLLEALVTAADARITIPMTPPVESLNVSVAAALLVFEARRQRASHRDR